MVKSFEFNKQDKSGIIMLVVLFIIGTGTIVISDSFVFRLIGWVVLALVGLTSFHVSRMYKREVKKVKKEWDDIEKEIKGENEK